ncbi:metallophosphoesterase family protein [uncultured Desulfosarcina sp.]|uniref:metallophosphoesterase family protein n=1 Tax=uncultured Desulfosarcina sp. TaxID=218289 RepID=UPI0029C8449B|nr:metallophosphoesterase family protein [uncultured Desulfosarcina sp.]
MNSNKPKSIGILSDTHGLVRPEVEKVLAGCDQILHAGDVGDGQVLKRLERIAPLMAVRGNTDHGSWSDPLPIREMIEIQGVFFYLLHDLNHLDVEPSAAGIHVVVSGHTHQPEIFQKNGVTYLNPGSAGHRRFNYPVSVAMVRIENGTAIPRIIEIEP